MLTAETAAAKRTAAAPKIDRILKNYALDAFVVLDSEKGWTNSSWVVEGRFDQFAHEFGMNSYYSKQAPWGYVALCVASELPGQCGGVS